MTRSGSRFPDLAPDLVPEPLEPEAESDEASAFDDEPARIRRQAPEEIEDESRDFDRPRTERPAAHSLADLEIPVQKLLNHNQEIRLGTTIQIAFARLRRLISLTQEGRESYLRQMQRVLLGQQVVVAWFPMRERLAADIERLTELQAQARRSVPHGAAVEGESWARRGRGRAGRAKQEAAFEALRQCTAILERYAVDPESLFLWARQIDSPRSSHDPLSWLDHDRRLRRIILRLVKRVEKARDLLVLPNLRLVLKEVFRFHPAGMRRSDLFQEGILGLHRAVFRYLPEKKTRFSTYATYWIRQSIRKALIDRSRLIRVPQAVQEELRSPNPKLPEQELQRVRRVMSDALSMSADEDWDHRDAIDFDAVRPVASPGHERLHVGAIPQAVERALSTLDLREREVVRRRFGIGGDPVQTLEEVGVAMHLSRERIRQIEREALSKMKRGKELESLYEELR
jgi:RNA polymerase sigma factor (sigma-70 family)